MAIINSSVNGHHHGVSLKSPHVVVLPFPAEGHTNPSIVIAHYLAASGIRVTLVQARNGLQLPQLSSSPSNGHHSSAAPETSPVLRSEVIPSGFDPLEPLSMASLMASLFVMRNALTKLLQKKLMLEENAPTCLLIDGFFDWSDAVAVEFGLSRVVLWTSCASTICMGLHVSDIVARGLIPATEQGAKDKIVDFIPGLSPFRITDLPKHLTAEEGLQSTNFTFFKALFPKARLADRILVNTMYELETSAVDALRKEDHVHIDPVGPLYMMSRSSDVSLMQEDKSSCLPWLDQQQQSSVLYIAFGSLASIEENSVAELAHGLEASGESFLWVIRPDAYKDKASVEEILPEGFMERTRDQGVVITWAPQLAVLGHPSVGAFLTHCGWNSVLESLSNGVPMLGFPQFAEQNTNLKLMVHDWKVGLPLLRRRDVLHADTRKVERSCVQSGVKAIMRGDEGLHARRHAREWKEIARKATHSHGSSQDNLQKLVDDLKHGLLKCPKH